MIELRTYNFYKNNAKSFVLLLLASKFHQVRLEEFVDIAVHNALNVGGLVVGSVVFHAAVVEDVGTDLTAPFDLQLARLDFILFLHAVTHLAVVEL